MIYSY
jgi:hypothetical protein